MHVCAGMVVRVDMHILMMAALEKYLKTSVEDKRANKAKRILNTWGLFAFFPGASGDPDTVIDPRAEPKKRGKKKQGKEDENKDGKKDEPSKKYTTFHEIRIKAFLGKI